MTTVVKVLVLNEHDQILLVFDNAVPEFQKLSGWGLPGGRQNPEDLDDVATGIRETEEETGIDVTIDPEMQHEPQLVGHRQIYFLARPIGGQLKDGARWAPKSVLDDSDCAARYCPEGIYLSHKAAGRKFLQILEERGESEFRKHPKPALTNYVRQDTAEGARPRYVLMTEEEIAHAVRKNRPVYYRNVGKWYSGNVTRSGGELWFKGHHRSETLGGRVKAGELFRKEK